MDDIFGLTDKGKKRPRNEDCVLINRKLSVFIVADGMGGHKLGNFASNTAANVVNKMIDQELLKAGAASLKDEDFISSMMKSAIQTANTEIYNYSQRSPEKATMGTTLTMMFIKNKKLFTAHVGDSCIFRLRKNIMEKLTKDHSVVQQMVDEGKIAESEARLHPLNNVLTKAIGAGNAIEPDIKTYDIEDGDCYLLGTDGLTKPLELTEIKEILEKNMPAKETCNTLLNMVLDRGAPDNVSIIVVKSGGEKSIFKRIFPKFPRRG